MLNTKITSTDTTVTAELSFEKSVEPLSQEEGQLLINLLHVVSREYIEVTMVGKDKMVDVNYHLNAMTFGKDIKYVMRWQTTRSVGQWLKALAYLPSLGLKPFRKASKDNFNTLFSNHINAFLELRKADEIAGLDEDALYAETTMFLAKRAAGHL